MSDIAETLQKEFNEMEISRITKVTPGINSECLECYIMTVDNIVYLVPKKVFEANKAELINRSIHPSLLTGLKCSIDEWDNYLENKRMIIEKVEVNDPTKPNDDIITAIF